MSTWTDIKCPKCDRWIIPSNYCPHCGYDLRNRNTYCEVVNPKVYTSEDKERKDDTN